MCNEVSRKLDLDLLRIAFERQFITIRTPEGAPNIEPTASIRITDASVIVRMARDEAGRGQQGAADLVTRRWSWPGQGGKPVYNYRSEGRDFRNSAKQGRCLIPVDGFYEFTASADPARKRKDKWLFRWRGAEMFTIAGLWKQDEAVGEAFTLLTCEPGPDIAPYHSRQVVLLPPDRWGSWLDGSIPAQELIAPLPAGTLTVEPAGAPTRQEEAQFSGLF